MLTSRVFVPSPANPEKEDIFSSALGALFTDDTQNSHGHPGGSVVYTSPRFGGITLQIPTHPDDQDSRRLFAHHLWNAAVITAEGIERASGDEEGVEDGWTSRWWNVRGRNVLELGAGTALPSVIGALSGATSITITDHPSSPALTTGAIQQNVQMNLFPETSKVITLSQIVMRGYVWGEESMYSPDQYGKPLPTNQRFDRIIVADCLWMSWQHENLIKTICKFLDGGPDSCAIVVAGFHTGRNVVANFFQLATRPQSTDISTPRKLHAAELYEVDVDGKTRPWQLARPAESKEQAKRWCAVGILTQSRTT